MLIDCCAKKSDSDDYVIPPLHYLRKIGVPFENIKWIVATHWHKDHVKKISEVVEKCPEADFYCSQALYGRPFYKFVSRHAEVAEVPEKIADYGVYEFEKVFDQIRSSSERKLRPLGQDEIFFRKKSTSGQEIKFWSLAPTNRKSIEAKIEIVDALTDEEQFQKLAPDDFVDQNSVSLVLFLELGKRKIILGGDYETTSESGTGWSRIVKTNIKPDGESGIFKIPHHGSSNAHNKKVWSELLLDQPISILAPKNNMSDPLPTEADIYRILANSEKYSFSAGKNNNYTINRSCKRTKKALRRRTKWRKKKINTEGQVRLRTPINDDDIWSMEMFGDAYQLKEVVSDLDS